MQQSIVARDIMVTKLITLQPHMDVFDAIELLLAHEVSGAPVVNSNGEFVGVFTEKDCLRLLVNAAYEQLPTTQIHAFMKRDVCVVGEDDDLLTIAQIFLREPFRRLPVVRDGRLSGQISRRDILRAINSPGNKHVGPPRARLLYLSSLLALDDSPIQ